MPRLTLQRSEELGRLRLGLGRQVPGSEVQLPVFVESSHAPETCQDDRDEGAGTSDLKYRVKKVLNSCIALGSNDPRLSFLHKEEPFHSRI